MGDSSLLPPPDPAPPPVPAWWCACRAAWAESASPLDVVRSSRGRDVLRPPPPPPLPPGMLACAAVWNTLLPPRRLVPLLPGRPPTMPAWGEGGAADAPPAPVFAGPAPGANRAMGDDTAVFGPCVSGICSCARLPVLDMIVDDR